MRIVHVAAPAPIGGLEFVLGALARGQSEGGHDVSIVAVSNDSMTRGAVEGAFSDVGVDVHIIATRPRQYISEYRQTRAVFRYLAPDVVHTHGYRSDFIGGRAARSLGCPCVTTCHGFGHGSIRNRVNEYLQRREFRRFDAVVAVSQPMAETLLGAGVPEAIVHTIPNAPRISTSFASRLEARSALELRPDGPTVGWIGRLSHAKGVDLLIEALSLTRSDHYVASIIGDGPERRRAAARARHLHLGDRVVWHGSIPAAARFMRAFDVLVLSSRTEGTPIVLLEAMAAQVPIIAFGVGGVPDVLDDYGVIVPSGDVAALAAAIDTMLSNEEAGSLAGEDPISTERHDDWLRRYESLYLRVSNKSRPGGVG